MRRAGGRRVRWVASAGHVEALRTRKDPQELAKMRRAAVLAGEVLEGALKLLKPGVRELEVAAEIEYQMRQLGASGPAFETIVAFGERSAFPHARPTAKRLRKNELVVLDLGAILAHYCSDITRTVLVGRASDKNSQVAQGGPGSAGGGHCSGKGRSQLRGSGRGSQARFWPVTGLIGTSCTAPGTDSGWKCTKIPGWPRDRSTSLEPGNVITIEPGVYVPGRWGHPHRRRRRRARRSNTEVLTRIPRDLIEI